ncbi:ribonuclease E inhibitor RraB [Streptomyces viridochromogenes]|uniref:ribonuclease E inhibitor RraB n=1 Tax=Streptomyces viridochromogenes TaxID=1938 RepID=UPI001F23005F|nr:ribonuclease E inhibitor RraB [Streptomyces viridochromogenes]
MEGSSMWLRKSGRGAAEFKLSAQGEGRRRRIGRWRTAANRAVERDLHRLIRRELQDLGVTPPLDVDELCQALSRRRGRPLYLREAPLPKPGPSGMWVEYDDYDVILYQQETTRLHQDHIKLHEIGHILVAENEEAAKKAAGETTEEAPEVDPDEETAVLVEGWATMLPVFDPETIKRVARRCSYDDGEECSVELVATIILEWSSLLDSSTPLSDDPSLRRVESALSDRRGWL